MERRLRIDARPPSHPRARIPMINTDFGEDTVGMRSPKRPNHIYFADRGRCINLDDSDAESEGSEGSEGYFTSSLSQPPRERSTRTR